MNDFLKSFADPPAECRIKPFWFWNSRLDHDEISSQIKIFKEMGLGGFFIHARFGLETPYLSNEWLDAVEAAILEAEKQNLEVWLYDENLFPSGIGGTMISRQLEFRPKFIEYGTFRPIRDISGYFVPLSALPEGCKLFSAQFISDEYQYIIPYQIESGKIRIDIKEDKEISLFWINTINNTDDMIFGVDYLNPETIKEFIRSAHEIYKEHFGKWFGSVIKGFFTDEPTLLPWHHDLHWYISRGNGRCVPYLPRLLDEMKLGGLQAADIESLAGALFFDCGSVEHAGRLRRSYWETIERLYKENFFKVYMEWCEENKLMLTGHVLLEEGLYFNHIFQAGPLSGLEYMHMPGVDQLSSNVEQPSMSYMVGNSSHMPEVRTNVTGPKLVSSIAHVTGRRQVISESFGVGGWGLQYRHMKAIVDWEYSLGVNRLCPHAFFYSIEGIRKCDAPPCHFHNTNASMYRYFADYTARMSWALSQGKPFAGTAVIYPESAFRGYYAAGRQREHDRRVSDTYDLACAALLNLHRGFEILTEQQLSSAALERGRLTIPENRQDSAIAGVMCDTSALCFSYVIVPSIKGMRPEVVSLLERFAASGGRLLVFNDEEAEEVNIKGNEKGKIKGNTVDVKSNVKVGDMIFHLKTELEMDRGKIIKILSAFFESWPANELQLTGDGCDHVYMICRKTKEGLLYLLTNTDTERYFTGNITAENPGIVILNAETGGYNVINSSDVFLKLAPGESILALLPENWSEWIEAGVYENHCVPGEGSLLENAGTIQTESFKASTPYVQEVEISTEGWNFNTAGLNALPVSDWVYSIKGICMTTEYSYSASVFSETCIRDLFLVLDDIDFRAATMGKPKIFVSFNGCECEPDGWHIDTGFKKFRINELKAGENRIEIIIRHSAWSGEPRLLTSNAVLLGRFGLKKADRGWIIVEEPSEIRLDAWNSQGYPFYSGKGIYTKRLTIPEGDDVILEIEAVDGCARLLIDGRDAGVRLWAPWCWEIPAEMAGQCVVISLEVTNTLANYLGEECRSGPGGHMLFRSCHRNGQANIIK